MSYAERSLYSIHNVYFRATPSEVREIRARSTATPQWLEWATLDHRVTHGIFKATDPAAAILCERLAELERAMTQQIVRLVNEVCADPNGD